MGVPVTYIPSDLYDGWGSYDIKRETITLASPAEGTFFHELAHHVHGLVLAEKGRKIIPGQHALQEVTAELSAAVLCKLVGREPGERMGTSYQYIRGYAEKADMTVSDAIKAVLEDVEKILEIVMEWPMANRDQ